MSRADKAREYFLQGRACSQAVALAFADLAGVGESQLAGLLLPFGGGFARMRMTCGAVSGMAAIVGAIYGGESGDNKKEVYAIVRELCEQFRQKCGSIICSELLGMARVDASAGGDPEARTAEYYKKRPCDEMVYIAADILESYIAQHPADESESI